jgi:hypothetical protein
MKTRDPFVLHFAERTTTSMHRTTLIISARVMLDGEIYSVKRTFSKAHDTPVVTDALRNDLYRELISFVLRHLPSEDSPHSLSS